MPLSRVQVTIREAAEMLGSCEATIYNMIKRGDIKTVGRRKRLENTKRPEISEKTYQTRVHDLRHW